MPFSAGEHPRLYFSKDELPALRTRVQHGERANALARYIDWCERLLDPSNPDYFDYHDFGKPHWRTRKSIFLVRPTLLMLSFTYALTGEQRYGEAARDAVLSFIKHRLADAESMVYGNEYQGWRRFVGHDKSIYAWAMCSAYDICHELFNEQQRQIFIDHALESIELIYNNREAFLGDMGQMINNRGARGQIGAFGYWPLTLEGDVEVPNGATHIQQSIAATEAFLHVAFDEDGACFEGPGYANCLDQFGHFTGMLARSGRLNLRRGKRWEQFLHHQVQELLPGGFAVNNLNDCHSECGTAVPSLFLMGTEQGAILPWLARQLDLHPKRLDEVMTDLAQSYTAGNSISMLLYWDDDAPVRTPEELGYPTARLFPHRGIASMRTGWEANDALISHRCGREMWRLHKQGDQNHLALYALGEKFLVDEGYGQPDFNRMENPQVTVNRYFGCADVHNTMLIDGRDQNGHAMQPGWAEGRLIDFQHTADFDTSLGDASEAYGIDHAIESAMRRVVFVHNTPQPFIIVIDTARVDATATPHDYEVLWRTEIGNSIKVDGTKFMIVGQHNDCAGEVLHPAEVRLVARTHYNREQLRVQTTSVELAMVTALAPVVRGAARQRFTCATTDEGDFRIEANDGAIKHTFVAGTRTAGVLHTPIPVRYERE